MLQHHIAIICSSEKSLEFYRDLGFEEYDRNDRGYDIIVWMQNDSTRLEIFIDPTHPAHVDRPEAYGLRHIAFECDDVDQKWNELKKWNPEEIKEKFGKRIFFVKDPDGCPIEIRER